MSSEMQCDLIEVVKGEEVHRGHVVMPHAPRSGEMLWLHRHMEGGLEEFLVSQVCYWVNDTDNGGHAYCKAAVYGQLIGKT
jgi:hypothetical protein